MKKNKNKRDIALIIFTLVCMAPIIIFFTKAGIESICNLIALAKLFYENPLAVTLSLGVTILLIYVILSWDKRDDFFFFVASILSSPSNYIYENKKKMLLNYRNEIKELKNYINYITNNNFNNLSKEDFWKFVDATSKQNERLEKNRQMLEKKNNKLNIFVQIIILCCGIITSFFL